MTDKVVKLKKDIDYKNLDFWNTEDAAGLKYFLNKAVVFKGKSWYNKSNGAKTSDKVQK